MDRYPNISAADCENIIDVIQKEFDIRRKEHEFLSKLQKEIDEQTAERNILSKRRNFNNKYCILCCSSFNLLFRRRIQCYDCHFWVCRACSIWEYKNKYWICEVCEKQRILYSESWAWFYKRLKTNFKYFGTAKVLEKICKKKKLTDSENDSGYGPSSDLKPILNLFSLSSKHTSSDMADYVQHVECDNEEDDLDEEEEETEIHHSIETIVEGLLGSSLDDASVDLVYINCPQYKIIFSTFHNKLIEVIRNLSYSLRRALHSMPHNNISPTVAHAALKHLICDLVTDCQNLPYLKCQPDDESDAETSSISSFDVDIFSSYEGLVASAIINKVVEENQAKFLKIDNYFHVEECASPVQYFNDDEHSETSDKNNYITPEDYKVINETFTDAELPLEYVQIEEVEEITREYTDSDDDKFSSVSHQSVGIQSPDELCCHPCYSQLNMCYIENDGKIQFPEFGLDLVEDINNDEDNISCRITSVTSWEENWLFRKKRRLPLYSNLKYQLLTYYDKPPCMLIPCPSVDADDKEKDDLSSELSESHSVGSLEFSSESGDIEGDDMSQDLSLNKRTGVSSCVITNDLPMHDDNLKAEPYQLNKTTQICEVQEGNQMLLNDTKINVVPSQITESRIKHSVPDIKLKCEKAADLFPIPTQPGTIAEREHKKWLNAVPLKNNPYSAENISKRCSHSNKSIHLEHAASFEEFKHRLNQCTIKEPLQTKLDCGLKTIDVNLYKRDYYVNSSNQNGYQKTNIDSEFRNSLVPSNCENFESIPDEALNSFEEKVYVSAGKLFTSDNHVRRLEREIKESSLSSLPMSVTYAEKITEDALNVCREETSISCEPQPTLPSVKCLATKFNWSIADQTEDTSSDVTDNYKVEDGEKMKKSRPCIKVHSLTARSLSREFRDHAKQIIPKPMNRHLTLHSQASDDGPVNETLYIHSFSPTMSSMLQSEFSHGYTSDESNDSTSSLPRPKINNEAQSVLQRASYWERRVEQGLLSDASVSEEFPRVYSVHSEI